MILKVSRIEKEDKRDALHGRYCVDTSGKAVVVEYEADPDLRDTEQVPLLEDGGIEGFFRREVLPYAPDAWIDASKTAIGYEISFTRHFYKPKPLRTLKEIETDIRGAGEGNRGISRRSAGGRRLMGIGSDSVASRSLSVEAIVKR